MNYPSPTSGASPESNWLNQSRQASLEREVLSIEGFKKEQTTNGQNWKKNYSPPPPIGVPSNPLSHPFKIYQPTNFASFNQGVTFLGTDGTPTLCNIDSTKPTDFTAVPPTVNPATDAWRFWAVRSGYVENRPIYNVKGAFLINLLPSSAFGYDAQNYVWKWIMGTDGDVNPDGTDGNCPPRGVAFDDPTTVPVRNQVLILSGEAKNTSHGNYTSFGFWINVTSDTVDDLAVFKIYCLRADNSAVQDSSPFPNNSSAAIIPLARVGYNTDGGVNGGNLETSNPIISQYTFDHIKGRFPNQAQGNFRGNSYFSNGSVMNFRGNWDAANDNTSPPDLKDQVFYPGDVVLVINTDPDGSRALYQFVGAATTVAPYIWEEPQGSDRWRNIT